MRHSCQRRKTTSERLSTSKSLVEVEIDGIREESLVVIRTVLVEHVGFWILSEEIFDDVIVFQ